MAPETVEFQLISQWNFQRKIPENAWKQWSLNSQTEILRLQRSGEQETLQFSAGCSPEPDVCRSLGAPIKSTRIQCFAFIENKNVLRRICSVCRPEKKYDSKGLEEKCTRKKIKIKKLRGGQRKLDTSECYSEDTYLHGYCYYYLFIII